MKINLNNVESVQKALDKAQKGTHARLLSVTNLRNSAERAERRLAKAGIAPGQWQGARVHINPHRTPNTYGHAAYTTAAILERGGKNWFLVQVVRTRCESVSYGADAEDVISYPYRAMLIQAWAKRYGLTLTNIPGEDDILYLESQIKALEAHLETIIAGESL